MCTCNGEGLNEKILPIVLGSIHGPMKGKHSQTENQFKTNSGRHLILNLQNTFINYKIFKICEHSYSIRILSIR